MGTYASARADVRRLVSGAGQRPLWVGSVDAACRGGAVPQPAHQLATEGEHETDPQKPWISAGPATRCEAAGHPSQARSARRTVRWAVSDGALPARVGDVREPGTGLVSDLASRGYVVVTMDDTYEAAEVEFPNGRIATPRGNQFLADSVRIADTRFVLDELARLRSGANPDAQQRALP